MLLSKVLGENSNQGKFTSFVVISSFTRKGQNVKEKSLLHSIHWGRIILDEAHAIKDRSCSTARAVFGLKGDIKWSVSGTPLQVIHEIFI